MLDSLTSPWPHNRLLCVGSNLGLQCLLAFVAVVSIRAEPAIDYAAVHPIFAKHCLDCHASNEPEAKLVLESFETLMRGGENGPAIVPSRSQDSLLIKMVEGNMERGGKRLIMPPGKRPKLSASEIDTLKSWIESGAKPPANPISLAKALVVPSVVPLVTPRRPIHALAYAPGPNLVALGRDGEVELVSAETQSLVRTLTGQQGVVNGLVFSADGKFLFAAGGQVGLRGEVRQWNVTDGALVQTFEGHQDAIYGIALSPDGKTLATGSYDQKIKLWQVDTGAEFRTLSGHNGAVFGLAFRPDGRILASASADRTVKLWDVRSGERRDTLSQSLKENNAVAFSPDGQRLFAGGGDNRIRVWSISENALETTNPILESRFAHEGAILSLVISPDGKWLLSSASDHTVKIWDAIQLTEQRALERQPDWAPALAFLQDNKAVAVGRLDGTFAFYDSAKGTLLRPPKPELARLEPRGIQRGTTERVKLVGAHLENVSSVHVSNDGLKANLERASTNQPNERWISLSSDPNLSPGPYELFVQSDAGDSAKVKLFVDDLPQLSFSSTHPGTNSAHALDRFPVSVWGVHEKSGDADALTFEAAADQSLVFDIAAQRFGSKADIVLTLSDSHGKVLATRNRFGGRNDPLLFYIFQAAGQYTLRVSELVLAGSHDHFYRLSAGAFPYVTGCFPMSVPANQETELKLIGYNLPPEHRVKVNPSDATEVEVPLPPPPWRSRGDLKVLVSTLPDLVEVEPNDRPEQATLATVPCAVNGRLWSPNQPTDVDLFRFHARAGQPLVIETAAAQRGSPADTRLDVLHSDGRPVERLVLQASRDSAVTFRGIDSDSTDCRLVNWEEMDLNQYLYLQGEVVRLFRAPQGPDSGFLFYSAHGKRRCYFDTSPAAHAVDEPCYIVEPHPAGAKLVSNGLPVFPVFYSNDDDSERKLGADSSIHFIPPADGDYLVRITETRGAEGERFVYRLIIRPAAPDFNVVLKADSLSVNAGSGQAFTVAAERTDGFDGEISVSLNHLPAGFSASTPLVIEAGHNEAKGTLHASLDAPNSGEPDWAKVEVIANALVAGQVFVKSVNNFGTVKLADKPKVFVTLEPEPITSNSSNAVAIASTPAPVNPVAVAGRPLEIMVAPGKTVPALLHVERNGHDDLITFTVENLPHGVIVDNIGLNGVLIPKGQNEREIFITAAKWVPETDRLCFAVESQVGRQTSLPVLLRVRRNTSLQAAAH